MKLNRIRIIIPLMLIIFILSAISYLSSERAAFSESGRQHVNITVIENEFTYDGSPKEIVISDDSGIDLSEYTSIYYSSSGNPPVNAGTYSVIIFIDHPEYYGNLETILKINKKEAVIIIDESSLNQIYDGAPKEVDYSVSEPISEYTLTILYNGVSALPSNAGIYTVNIILNHINYRANIERTMVISKAPAAIIFDESSLIHIYDGEAKQVSFEVITPESGYSATVLYNSSLNPPINAGQYTVRIIIESSNYTLNTTYTMEINKADITGIDIEDIESVYNAESVIGQAVINPEYLNIGYNYYDNLGNLISEPPRYVGEYSYEAVFLGNNNYNPYTSDRKQIIVTPRAVTLSDLSYNITTNKEYDGNNSAPADCSFNFETYGDDINIVITAYYNSQYVLSANSIEAHFELLGSDSGNYVFHNQTITVSGSINQRVLTISAGSYTPKVYDGTISANAEIGSLTNIVNIDGSDEDVYISNYSAVYNDYRVSYADSIVITYLSLGGIDKDNYSLPIDTMISAEILKAEAEIIIELNQFSYTGAAQSPIITIDPAQSGGIAIEYIIYYDLSLEEPINAGEYNITIEITDSNYYGTKTGIMIISKSIVGDSIVIKSSNPLIIYDELSNTFIAAYSGMPISEADFYAEVEISGIVNILEVTLQGAEAVAVGLYELFAVLDSDNIEGEAYANLEIIKALGQIVYSDPLLTYRGVIQSAPEADTLPLGLNLIYTYSYDNGISFINDLPINAGIYQVKIAIDDINYFGEEIYTLTIDKSYTQIITPSEIDKTYTGYAVDISSLISFSDSDTDIIEIETVYYYGGIVMDNPPLNAGLYQVKIKYKNPNNFHYPETSFINLNINITTPSIIFTSSNRLPYTGYQQIMSAEIEGHLPATIEYRYFNAYKNEGIYIQGEEIDYPPIDVGFYYIMAYVEGDDYNYFSSEAMDLFEIYNAIVTIEAVLNSLVQEYSGDIREITVIVKDSMNVVQEINDYVVFYYSPTEPINPGFYAINAIIEDHPSFTSIAHQFVLEIVKKDLTSNINFSPSNTYEYTGAGLNHLPNISGGYDVGSSIEIKYNNSLVLPKNVGTYSVTATINHSLYSGTKSSTMIITKKTLTIKANDATMAYGESGSISFVYTGFVMNEGQSALSKLPAVRLINASLGVDRIGIGKEIVVGQYQMIPEGAEASNYQFVYQAGILTVTKATLTVYLDTVRVLEGVRISISPKYFGFKYLDNESAVFKDNRPKAYYVSGSSLSLTLPIIPGIYDIITDGGESDNYNIIHTTGAKYIIQRSSIKSSDSLLTINGVFHPNSSLSFNTIQSGSIEYKNILSQLRKQSILNAYYSAYSYEIVNVQLSETGETEYRLLIPDGLKDKAFKLYLITAEGEIIEQEYNLSSDYIIASIIASDGILVLSTTYDITLIIIVLASLISLLVIIFLTRSYIKYKKNNPKILRKAVAPVTIEPLEALEDEDAAFDAYIEKMVEEKAAISKSPVDIYEDTNILADEHLEEEEIIRKQEELSGIKQRDIDDTVSEHIERQRVASIVETRKNLNLMEFVPNKAGESKMEEEELSDEYIIDNELYSNSNMISMQEAQAMYPDRIIRKLENKVALEVCFESALNLGGDRLKYIYSEIKNTFTSYSGIESKMFKSGEAFKGGGANAILRIRNDALTIYLNIDKSLIPEGVKYTDHQDEPKYKDMAIEIVVSNGTELTSARKLINILLVSNGLTRDHAYRYVNYINKYPRIENAIIDEA